jgi:hypothetical protein
MFDFMTEITPRRPRSTLLPFVVFLLLAGLAAWLLYQERKPPQEAEAVPAEDQQADAPVEVARVPTKERAETQRPLPVHLTPVTVKEQKSFRGASFSGRVVSWTSGLGVAGAEMTFSRLQATYTLVTDEKGEFRFDVKEHGTYNLATVTADGYLPYAPAWGHSPVTLSSAPGMHIKDIVVYLLPAVDYLGKVIAPDGAPVEGATVKLFIRADRQPTLIPLPNQFASDQQGEFHFHAPDDTLVEARHPDFGPARGLVDRSIQVTHQMTLKLKVKSKKKAAGLVISGRVLDPEGIPLPDALVVARVASAGPFDPQGGWWSSVTGTDGRFRLDVLYNTGHAMTATYPGLTPAVATAAAGNHDVILKLGAGGGGIAGEVKARSDGRPVPGFVVVVSQRRRTMGENQVTSQSVFDPSGRYRVGSLPEGDYLVRILAHGFAASEPVPVSVQPPDDSRADFLLVVGGTLTGVVTDADTKKPIEGARVTVEGRVGGGALPVPVVASTITDARGGFVLGGIAPGLRSVYAMAYRYHGRILSGLEVKDGATLGPVEITLTKLKEGEEPKLELTGIGAVLAPKGDTMLIGRVRPGGGAAEAGLGPGDAILAVDGIPVVKLGFNGSIQRIRGPEGTTVLLTVRKAGGKNIQLEVFRRKIRG